MKTITTTQLSQATRSDRNRAVDFYRAIAMIFVAIGHWIAVAATIGDDGELVTGNALAAVPSLGWITWIFQVMPLFFVVGGFASAMSLDSHRRRDGRPQDWVSARLRRMLAPAVALAATWAVVFAVGSALGHSGHVGAGITAAAIPLWFLANYTIDTAIAPYTFNWFRNNRRAFIATLVSVYLVVEVSHLAGIGGIGHLNWVLGWLSFQVLGFAWRDGSLPTGRSMLAVSVVLWAATAAAVAFGPWPVSMVHHPGLEVSPTHPPSFALMLFGLAYSTTAIAAAPAVTKWLVGHQQAWTAVVAANGIAMSVYLWHMTAAVFVTAAIYGMGLTTTAAVGSAGWWATKPLFILTCMGLLAIIVAVVSPVERKALFARPVPWSGSEWSMLATAGVVSAAVKTWTAGSSASALIGVGALLLTWHVAFSQRRMPAPATTETRNR